MQESASLKLLAYKLGSIQGNMSKEERHLLPRCFLEWNEPYELVCQLQSLLGKEAFAMKLF